jgi:hypothetical protein
MKMENILLTRMVARVDVTNNALGFELEKVFVANRQTAGYIAPAWSTTDGAMLPFPYTPMIPGSSTREDLEYTYNASIAGDIYLFESPAASGIEGDDSHTDATCLILYGKYNGSYYYYRVDFTTGVDAQGNAPGEEGFKSATVAYMPVYRNHCYNFTVTEVNGVGSTSLADALDLQFLMNNMKTSLLMVNESRIKNILFDNEHYLGIESTEVFFDFEGGNTTVFCTTNLPSGWQIDASYGPGTGIEYTGTAPDGWLTTSKNGDNITLATVATGNPVMEGRMAKVHIRAGNLAGVINVTQEGLLYVGRFGGALLETNPDEWQFEKALYMQGQNQGGTNATYQWKTEVTSTPGTRSYLDGKGNTLAMTRTGTTHSAATACFEKNSGYASIEEKDDPNYVWYLPAQKQLQAVLVSHNSFGTKLSGANYWSATAADAPAAWFLSFGDSRTSNTSQRFSYRVRCVREVTTP